MKTKKKIIKFILIMLCLCLVTSCYSIKDLVDGERQIPEDNETIESKQIEVNKPSYIVEQEATPGEEQEEIVPAEEICLYFFHNNRATAGIDEKKFLEGLAKKYPNLKVKEFLTDTRENINLMYRLAVKYGSKAEYIPMTFIGSRVIKGFYTNETTGKEIINIIEGCHGCECPSPD